MNCVLPVSMNGKSTLPHEQDMSIRKIEDLSKDELLGLIYHQMGNTLYGEHPCQCACCGTDPRRGVDMYGKTWPVYWFSCDECESANASQVKESSDV